MAYSIEDILSRLDTVDYEGNRLPSFFAPTKQERERFGYEPQYREMTPLEKISRGSKEASKALSSSAGNAVLGEPVKNEDPSYIDDTNALRAILDFPGSFLSWIPDLVGYSSEIMAGTPAQSGDLETGLIEDRTLDPNEYLGDLGYTALASMGTLPSTGFMSGSMKAGLNGLAKAAGTTSRAGNALNHMNNVVRLGESSSLGPITRSTMLTKGLGDNAVANGVLSSQKLADVALDSIKGATKSAGKGTLKDQFNDMRYDNLKERTEAENGGKAANRMLSTFPKKAFNFVR